MTDGTLTIDGALLFARYAYPPNALGYCGPGDNQALLEYAAARVSDGGLRELARGFEGAWPYLELIAGAHGITDPLDARVVEAYWVGNGLLDGVRVSMLGGQVEERFRRVAGTGWSRLADSVGAGAVPHHSFHVFCVYPWVGLMRAGPSRPALHVLDRCRIRWGRVLEVDGDTAIVRARLLEWDGHRLSLGSPVAETVACARGGTGTVATLKPGDRVSMHWDWICDRISRRDEDDLRRYTARHLALVNVSAGTVAQALELA
ncbi:MAG: DUF6390 family protein [Actinomycetota bacterium]